jgi:hypothetical protein
MELYTIPGDPLPASWPASGEKRMKKAGGYALIILLMAVTVLTIGLLVAVPIWDTQLQREKEEELIFRGRQYVEAVRIFQQKHPGRFPATIDALLEEKCIRKLYPDPMSRHGDWNLILLPSGISVGEGMQAPQQVLVVPRNLQDSVQNAQILGVVSSSPKKSLRIYLGQGTYDKWLFFYGQDQSKFPEIIRFGQEGKEPVEETQKEESEREESRP